MGSCVDLRIDAAAVQHALSQMVRFPRPGPRRPKLEAHAVLTVKLRDALATLKDDMEVMAAEQTERMRSVSERAARAEAKALKKRNWKTVMDVTPGHSNVH